MCLYSSAFARLRRSRALGFCPFAVLGAPNEEETLTRIQAYISAGADFLELGIPFSDPVADGPVIQRACEQALSNGMTPRRSIALIKKIHAMVQRTHHDLPIGILTYANIVFRYGPARFCQDLKAAGAASLLIADLPLEESAPFARAARWAHLPLVFIASEYTDAARLKKIERLHPPFLYVVSCLGVTGARQYLPPSLSTLLARLKKQTSLPLMCGFGIAQSAHVGLLKKHGAQGGIVGSVLVATPQNRLKAALQPLAEACHED